MKMKTILIDRTKWLRGQDNGTLLNDEGKMCCLGFLCHQLRISKKNLLNIGMPDELSENFTLPEWLRVEGNSNSDVAFAARRNDSTTIEDVQREREIKKIFKKHGLIAKFFGLKKNVSNN